MDNKIEINDSPPDLLIHYETLFTKEALKFIAELVTTFNYEINELYYNRSIRKYSLKKLDELPKFKRTEAHTNKKWTVSPLPKRLINRHLDLGDVSPSNTHHFLNALNAQVEGIQVDFDDGHCPTWRNQIIGLHNVYKVVHGKFYGINSVENLPVLMLRPRAWNMIEHNIRINGKEVPGPIVDFAILMFHNARTLASNNSGPYFYLSKLESALEADLWNKIFVYSQMKLGIPYGTIKACVLIENILSVFELDDILYALKDHCCGLNCGIWDYAASIINKFGDRKEFVIPDRNKYVNMSKHFLKKYMQIIVQVCHTRATYATSGMAADLVPDDNPQKIIDKVVQNKKIEIQAGVDGFMVYDIELVPHMNKLWKSFANQIVGHIPEGLVLESDLFEMPTGGVTLDGLIHNIEVTILFIYSWLNGIGHFHNKGAVEDSATAEISRYQVWQWIMHGTKIENKAEHVSIALVQDIARNIIKKKRHRHMNYNELANSKKIFLQIVTTRDFPDFITTYLSEHYMFREKHASKLPINIRHKL